VPNEVSAPRVLLVDDAPGLLAMLACLLADYHIQVVGQAIDGDQVIPTITQVTARGGGVDVVVMDESMPRMRGLEATRQLRHAFPEVGVVLHSASAGKLGDEPTQAGITAEVPKGAHREVLVAAIYRACELARARRALATAP
jgi:DNA-binding NarL/FixJ family response regulator